MRNFACIVVLVASLMLSPFEASAFAPLKGRWTLTLVPEGQVIVITSIRFKGKGVGIVPQSPLASGAIAYRETDSTFSASWEHKTQIIVSGSFGTSTLLLRGTKTSDTTLEGSLLIITDTPDPLSPTGFETLTGVFTGVRDS
jgi:hypothetical protein